MKKNLVLVIGLALLGSSSLMAQAPVQVPALPPGGAVPMPGATPYGQGYPEAGSPYTGRGFGYGELGDTAGEPKLEGPGCNYTCVGEHYMRKISTTCYTCGCEPLCVSYSFGLHSCCCQSPSPRTRKFLIKKVKTTECESTRCVPQPKCCESGACCPSGGCCPGH